MILNGFRNILTIFCLNRCLPINTIQTYGRSIFDRSSLVCTAFMHSISSKNLNSHRYVQQIVAPGWGKINQERRKGRRIRGKNKYERVVGGRTRSVRFPSWRKVIWWWPSKGVKLKFMAEIDFKCFFKVVK